MPPTTRGRKKKEFKSAEFIEKEDDFVVDDEASDAGSKNYNDNDVRIQKSDQTGD